MTSQNLEVTPVKIAQLSNGELWFVKPVDGKWMPYQRVTTIIEGEVVTSGFIETKDEEV